MLDAMSFTALEGSADVTVSDRHQAKHHQLCSAMTRLITEGLFIENLPGAGFRLRCRLTE
jgi:hypothetical protein